uniref:Putative transcriptional coactivator caper rrm superfamily n=1 Tax=Phlebotomus kandelakii TaxID=1109342 RepID=A0A6B2EHQ8_9DIPT
MNKSRNQLERLSNVEIGQLLVQYGFPNIPVTATTRKVLLSRLRTRMQQDQEKLRKDTSYVTRYSSGEESDKDTRQMDLPSPQRPHKSTPYATMPPPASKKRHTAYPTVRVPIQPRNSVFVPPPIVADTDEDSDIHLPPDYKHNSYASSRLSGFTFRKRYTPQADDGPYLDAGASPRFAGTNTSSSSNGHNSAEESPYLSDFTKRLLRLRGETVSKEAATSRSTSNRYFSGQVPEINSSSSTIDSIVHHAPETPTLPRVPPPQQPPPPQSVQTALSNLLSHLDEQYGFKQTLVPCLLVTMFIVFITFVLFAYLTISPDLVNTLSAEVASVDLCEVDNPALRRPGYSCIERGEVDAALDMLKSIAPELQTRVEVTRCRDPGRSFTMTATEVIQMVSRANPTVTVMRIVQQLHNMEYLIERNPQWRVNHVNADGEALTLDEVVQLRESRGNCFGILNPRLPLSCLFWSKMQTFFLIVGTISLLGISVYGGNLFWRFIVHVKRSRQAKVDRMISEIISVLMEQTSNDSGGLVLVNHVRDKIIPPAQRRQLEAAWTEAIEHLEKNESRIQFEMGNRNGEDCRMMRWIDTVAPSMLHHRNTVGGSAVKKWLSPAFGKSNKIKDPPTACLKIRQMFEKYETNNPNLKTIITDAILEKVGPKCRIFDVQLEKTACCVYVRCATPKDAGIVHDEINGWWFDNHLVSIKFLRLERYTSRFPKANAGPAPLRPSNTKNLSMSQCFTEPPENAFADDDDED